MRHLRKTLIATSLALSAAAPLAQAACTSAPCPKGTAPQTGLDKNGHLTAVPLAEREGFAFARLKDGVQFRVGDITKNVIFYSPGTVRVNANLGKNHWTAPSIVVVDKPGKVAFDIVESKDSVTIKSARLRVTILSAALLER